MVLTNEQELQAAKEEVMHDFLVGLDENEPIGYFWETGIWSQGVLQPPRRTGILAIEPMAALDGTGSSDTVLVVSTDGNEYKLKKSDVFLF